MDSFSYMNDEICNNILRDLQNGALLLSLCITCLNVTKCSEPRAWREADAAASAAADRLLRREPILTISFVGFVVLLLIEGCLI